MLHLAIICAVLATLMLFTSLILRLKPKCTLFLDLTFEFKDRHVKTHIGIDENAGFTQDKYYILEVKDAITGEDLTGQVYIPDDQLVDAMEVYAWELSGVEDKSEHQEKLLSHLKFSKDLVQK